MLLSGVAVNEGTQDRRNESAKSVQTRKRAEAKGGGGSGKGAKKEGKVVIRNVRIINYNI